MSVTIPDEAPLGKHVGFHGNCVARFPERYHELHPDAGLNFQLNRMYGWVGEDRMLDELRGVAPRIRDYGDWRRELVELADGAIAQRRTLAGAYYLRLAEFFMFAGDPQKKALRDRFVELVLTAHGLSLGDRRLVPFRSGFLPAYRFTPPSPKSAIVIFGGYDSYIEEWFPMFEFFRCAGHDVIAFEGPGQGGALEEFNLTLTRDWHEPVGAILDHFALDDVTLMGLSLGGCLVIRASAFEKRVKRVVADDVMTSFAECVARQSGPNTARVLARLARVVPRLVDAAVTKRARQSLMVQWGVEQGLHVLGLSAPHEFFEAVSAYRTDDVSALVDQDVLLLCGAEDHYVPAHQLQDQMRSLTNARSLTTRTFTRAEQAQNHCQIGNLGLSLRVVTSWLESLGC